MVLFPHRSPAFSPEAGLKPQRFRDGFTDNYNKNNSKKHGRNKKPELISEAIPKYQILKQ
jgi:hypothetical protein